MKIRVHDTIKTIAPADWNRLTGTTIPFLRHEYFAALEVSGSLGPESGWTPRFLTLENAAGGLEGAIPLFEKTDSRGEFIFDWDWAAAMRQAGRPYYPKLVAAIPYTPVPGPRCLLAPEASDAAHDQLMRAAQSLATDSGCSSLHWLFVEGAELARLEQSGYLKRSGCDFVWHNPGADAFEGWLATLTAKSRKNIRRERRRVREAGVECYWRRGHELTDAELDTIYQLYVSTYYKNGMLPYLTESFFTELATRLPYALQVCFAERENAIVACAVFMQDDTTLYGRYWGAFEWINSLHFELCYYQGIAHAVREGLEVFHPGVQGEHKLLRGFDPTPHYSAHWLADPDLARAVGHFLEQERELVDHYINEAENFLPYHQGHGSRDTR